MKDTRERGEVCLPGGTTTTTTTTTTTCGISQSEGSQRRDQHTAQQQQQQQQQREEQNAGFPCACVYVGGVGIFLFGRSRSAESIAAPREHTGYILALVRHSYITCCAPEESTNPSLTARTASTPLR